ncbi:hypothetical protein [Marinimicrobium sp. ABcell2]|uniref:hypothetical protein n=1 Tax=Marinimicrobium sp. ABcell2 TaxID=3069751 RepID=UPI0027ADF845|nr:hypothetical protein [Marinimicrobium sp. ABcell2]MDQ2078220.1 hypothetical protein [Marinimicrobium sp. ABcell2]
MTAWTSILIGAALSLLSGAMPPTSDTKSLDKQRDELPMDSMSGGDFRAYISKHIQEDDPWAQSMRTFGSFHNFMHELMTSMARHGALERGDDTVPEFEHRISGGKWSTYREALHKAGEESLWSDLVEVTEVMHDRVHHAMVRSVVYDHASRGRDVDVVDYLRNEPMPAGEGIPSDQTHRFPIMSLEQFREVSWSYEAERRHWHSAMQQGLVFAHMLDDLLTQWLAYGADHADSACRPTEGAYRQRGLAWPAYAQSVADCEDADWREFVQVAGLMRDRVHHMLHLMASYRDWTVPTSLSQPLP